MLAPHRDQPRTISRDAPASEGTTRDFISYRRQLLVPLQAASCRLLAASHRAHRFPFAWPSSWFFWTVSDSLNRRQLRIVITTVAAVLTGSVIGCL